MTRILVLIALLTLAGCAFFSSHLPVPALRLLPVSAGPTAAGLSKQKVVLQKSRTFRFISVMRFDKQALRGAVLLPSGQTLLTYRYTDHLETQPVEPKLPVREMLALMQFALWPAAALQLYPQASPGWRVELKPGHRQLLWYDRPVISVVREPGKIQIEQHQKGYSLLVEDLAWRKKNIQN